MTDGSGVSEVIVVAVSALFTAWVSAAEALAAKFGSPPYSAVMLWLPTPRVEVLKAAVPPLSGAVPKVVAPSLKVTVPVGVPVPGATGLTVAVKLTDCPKTDGFWLELTVVVAWVSHSPGGPRWLSCR